MGRSQTFFPSLRVHRSLLGPMVELPLQLRCSCVSTRKMCVHVCVCVSTSKWRCLYMCRCSHKHAHVWRSSASPWARITDAENVFPSPSLLWVRAPPTTVLRVKPLPWVQVKPFFLTMCGRKLSLMTGWHINITGEKQMESETSKPELKPELNPHKIKFFHVIFFC